jgi:hypothetical protein
MPQVMLMILPLERRGKELKLFVEHVSDKIKWNRHRQSGKVDTGFPKRSCSIKNLERDGDST